MPKVNEGQIEIKGLNFPNQLWAVNPFQGNLVGNNAAVAVRDELFELGAAPHPFPIPQPQAPIQPDFIHHFQGMDLVVPGWTKYVTQEADGRIVAHESKPFKFNGAFAVQGGRWSIVVKPEPYEQIIEEIAQW